MFNSSTQFEVLLETFPSNKILNYWAENLYACYGVAFGIEEIRLAFILTIGHDIGKLQNGVRIGKDYTIHSYEQALNVFKDDKGEWHEGNTPIELRESLYESACLLKFGMIPPDPYASTEFRQAFFEKAKINESLASLKKAKTNLHDELSEYDEYQNIEIVDIHTYDPKLVVFLEKENADITELVDKGYGGYDVKLSITGMKK